MQRTAPFEMPWCQQVPVHCDLQANLAVTISPAPQYLLAVPVLLFLCPSQIFVSSQHPLLIGILQILDLQKI